MNSDSCYKIGKGHQICQDYTSQGLNYVLISDGCSSSPHTDIGARILVRTAVRLLKSGTVVDESFSGRLIEESNTVCTALGLPSTALDATFLAAIAEDEKLKLILAGDGHLAIGWNDGVVSHHHLEYTGGFPYYLSYTLNSEREAAFRQKNQVLKVKNRLYLQEKMEYRECPDSKKLRFDKEQNYLALPLDKISFVALFSDGIDSFYRLLQTESGKVAETLSCYELLPELLAIRQRQGECVKRRVNKFMQQVEKRGIIHYDDFSYGALFVE